MKIYDKHIFLNRRHLLKQTVAGAAALGLGLAGFPAIAVPKKHLTVGYIPILDHLVLAISHAKDKNSFQNIDVTPRLFKSWRSIAGALEAGVIDAAFLLSNMAMDIFNRGVPIRSILVGHRNGSGITVRVDSTIRGPKGLASKTIAIPAAISTHTALLDAYLRTGGLSLEKVTTREIAPPLMIPAMLRGSIDAFIVAEPFCAMAEQEKVGRMLAFSKDIVANHICCVLVVRQEVVAANPEGIQEWVISLVRAGQWIDEKKMGTGAGEIAKMASAYMPQPERAILGGLRDPDDRVVYKDLDPRLADYQVIVDMSRKANLIQSVDLDRFIDHSFYKGIAV